GCQLCPPSWSEISISSLHIHGHTFALTYSLRYVFTGTSGIPDFPEFVGVGLVDGEPIDYYDSRIGRMTPRQDWMTKAVDADYWDRETQHLRGGEQVFKTNIEVAKQRFNQTGGIHTAQMMYGCELDGDGTIRGYNLQGYDGEDFISLDLNTLTWTAANQKITCIEWLKKYLDHGRDTLQKKVPPVVSLLHRDDSSPVICHATGFSPSGVVMFWQKDGLELHDDVTVGETVPNGDGTFQKRISLRVSPEDLREHVYTCTVQHISDDRDVVKAVMEKQILSNRNPTDIGMSGRIVRAFRFYMTCLTTLISYYPFLSRFLKPSLVGPPLSLMHLPSPDVLDAGEGTWHGFPISLAPFHPL
uniref:Major histocompatibility complex class I UKA n=1 Tax=Paramormyrops kingsleyae TaxID=1676925 RepID=A0A3B3Q4I3_9TELE